MLPKLWEEIKPISKETEAAVAELAQFARGQVPEEIWQEESKVRASASLVEKHKRCRLTDDDYRILARQVRKVVTWENQTPAAVWPTTSGLLILSMLFAALVVLPELLGPPANGGGAG